MRRRQSSTWGGTACWLIGDAGRGRVDEADRLVRQLAAGDVAMREPDGRLDGLVQDLDLVMLLERGQSRASCGCALSSSGSSTLITWKRRVRAGSFSMCFLYSSQVVAAMVRSVPRARAGLSRLAASPVPAAAGPDEGVGLVDEQDDRLRRGLDFVDDACAGGSRIHPSCWRRPAASPMSRDRRVTFLQLRAERHRPRSAGRSPRRPRSCPRRPRRSGSGCSAGGASGCRRSGGFPRPGR